ncbi:MAG TPA: STING domain-containing protein [Cyclobacteriaceae bacterium]|nr:STING domain-containing protein [Cyclobacteriaceae bacterium]
MPLSLKFFSIKDMFYSVVPTAGTYGGYLNGLAPNLFTNIWIAVGIGVGVSIVLAFLFYIENVRAYKRSLAEILATGYFMNFTGRLGKLLRSKAPVDFQFPDNTVRTFDTANIRVEIGMPATLASLSAYSNSVERNADIIYVREQTGSEPFWLRAKVQGDLLVIYEFPRTLFSLSRYLKADFSNKDAAEKNSKQIYSYFQEKIDQLRIEYVSEISEDKLDFKTV